ncbi:MAG: dTDP-glucose 4,6-dehydratase [Candidatus Methanoperedens sp.]|nr:dTDP-glucose 4,6-dehydratase [Candidatus Methanoperedens sp.]
MLVSGGCGFIGSNFIRHLLLNCEGHRVVNLDCLTYAGNPENLRDIDNDDRYSLIPGRIEDADLLGEVLTDMDAVVHFAAESHVDRSIADAQPFLRTNVIGTQTLIEAARLAGVRRFVHISTDEVYGTLGGEGSFTEESPLRPNSPYAASKAAGDLMVRAAYETHRFPVVTVRPSNNYGPYQYPEKFIPLLITNLLEGRPVPVYGDGRNVRDRHFVEDCCAAIELALRKGMEGETYNVGGRSEERNINIVRKVISILGMDESSITFVPDRPGHDYRYALDVTKIGRDLGWQPATDLDTGLRQTVRWYQDHAAWWRPLKDRLAAESRGFWTTR